MSQNSNTSFTSYHEPIVKDIDNIDRVERDQSQVQALVPTNTQDPLTNLG